MSSNENKSILKKELNIKEILVVISVFIVFLGYIFLFIYPEYSELKQAKVSLKFLQNKRVDLQEKIDEMSMLEKKLTNLESELEIKSKILEYDIQDGMFLIGLSKLMNEVNVELIEYSVDEIKEYDNFYALPATIQIRGDYQNIGKIIYYLEDQENMTQVLNFDIKTYEEEKNENKSTEVSEVVPDSIVYWTNSGITYHKKDCPMLQLESTQSGEEIQSGSVDESGKRTPDENCKPYAVVDTNTDTENALKSSGIVTATFNFISYSSQNPSLEFNNDNPTTWTPGKYNPFKTTSR